MMNKLQIKRCVSALCVAGMLATVFPGGISVAAAGASDYEFSTKIELETADDYATYLQEHAAASHASKDILIDGGAFTAGENAQLVTDYKGNKGDSVLTDETGFVEWTVEIEKDALYSAEIEYYPVEGKGVTITRSLQIDGELPFSEARNLFFSRVYTDQCDENGVKIATDAGGNDIRPTQVEAPAWQTAYLKDSTGYVVDPLQFYLTAGTHTIRLTSTQEPMAIRSIRLCKYELPAAYQAPSGQSADADPIKMQGEAADLKSDATMIPLSDRSNSAIEPSHVSAMKLNCVGGTDWQANGQMLTWNFHVEKAGLYKIAIKTLQNFTSGSSSYRRIYIDGKVPFAELDKEAFAFSNKWQMHVLGGEEEPYAFYFEEGDHSISMEVTLGGVADLLGSAVDLTNRLNSIYRDILMITGSTADVNRDYQFDVAIPDTLKEMVVAGKDLDALYNLIIERNGSAGQSGQLLHRLAIQLEEMTENPDSIAAKFSAFQNNVASLGTWISSTEQQPLTIDYLLVTPLNSELPSTKDTFWNSIKYHVGSFIYSFIVDYNVLSSDTENAESIRVWVGSGLTGGRDQAQIIKTLIGDSFTPQTDIAVQMQLVSMGALLPAYMSGGGPDVVLSLSAAEIMNYAFRSAALDLSQFEELPEIQSRFHESSLVPLSFDGKCYGVPETQSFPVLFYRKDILLELGLELPSTWDDVIEMLPVLQKQMFQFGLPTVSTSGASMPMYNTFLLQHGGTLYAEDAKSTLVNMPVSETAFSFFTRLYTDYKIPQTIDFVTRFRMGDVPIGIADYQLFNQLSVFAPQLEGLWGFSLIPGTVREDGTIDRSVPAGVTGTMVLNNTKNKDAAWEFLKWWTDADTQVIFGRQLESIMGTAARYPTANMEAMQQIPWTKEFSNVLNAQWAWADGVPEIPGSYYTPRNMDFAFRGVVNSSEDIAESLEDAAREINAEIAKKRKEFGLS
ncbi:MAG: extracellular solute-binding protein [Clostridia bacterium]|nr:extracellular solute-binding protein [Clostridia bacterium]